MLGHDFWWDLFRKHVIVFGNLFNDIKVYRTNKTNTVMQVIPVPIEYAERDKMLARIQVNPDLATPVAITLPRMSFEITGWQYEPQRNLNNVHQRRQEHSSGNGNLIAHYSPQPVIINFQLNLYTKFAYDAFQIIEQITPFFKPEWSVSAKLVQEMYQVDNIRIVLESVVKNDDATQGPIDERRTINWTLNFAMHTHFIGPISRQGLIKRVELNFLAARGSGTFTTGDLETAGLASRFVLTPGLTANGMPTSDPEQTIPYSQIGPLDDYGLIEEWTDGLSGEISYTPTTYTVSVDEAGDVRQYIMTGPKTYLPLTGGALSGYITLHDDPTNASHPVTLHYLETNAAPRELVKIQTVNANTPSLTINLDLGNYVILNLDSNITSLTFTGWDSGIVSRCTLDIRYGGAYDITWGSVLWPSAEGDPELSSRAGAKDVIALYTPDAGTTIFGTVAGLDYQ